jgi:hypothetical protein
MFGERVREDTSTFLNALQKQRFSLVGVFAHTLYLTHTHSISPTHNLSLLDTTHTYTHIHTHTHTSIHK